MSRGPHPRSADLLRWFTHRRNHAQAIEDVFYRVAGPRHTTAKDIVSGVGAWVAGGRWNPSGEMRVVYLCRQPETALREALANHRYYGLPLADALPKITVAVRVKVNRFLDLTDAAVVSDIPISMSELIADDWRALVARGLEPASQAAGWAAFSAGYQALAIPSKPDPMGVNILVFPESLTTLCRLEVMNAADLDNLGKPV